MRQRVLGTAGHIDHGKSALVRALTGTDPDRLKEEKLRGITIDLGFADLDLGEERAVSFVDVPGHERFVRHMVAGSSGMDAVLLVIAADEGVKPQTREHLAICSLLDVRHGLVALTKSDLVEGELLEVVALEVRDFLSGTFLASAPILAVSSKTGSGIESLRQALEELFAVTPDREATGVLRLPVDRSFVLRGFGTVVTGTLASGSLRDGDEIVVLPGGREGRVRGLQVHHRRVLEARAGQRTAANLQGLDCVEAPRGSTIAFPGELLTTRRVLASVRLLESGPAPLRRGGPVRFHQGTCERPARIRVLGGLDDDLLEVEVHLGSEAVLLPGDRFILRRPAPVGTIGGGTVLDVRPPRDRRGASCAKERNVGDPVDGLQLRLARAGPAGRDPREIAAELGLATGELARCVAGLEAAGRVVTAAGRLFDAGVWARLEESVLEVLQDFHRREPLRLGVPREDLRSRFHRDVLQESWRDLLERLDQRGLIRLSRERVALTGHRVVMSESDSDLARVIESRFLEAGLDPPNPGEVVGLEHERRSGRILELLVEEGRLVRIADGRLFHAKALEDLRNRLQAYAKRSKKIDVGTFKQLAGVTRRNAIPLLEQLDAERLTRRVGNVREILSI